MKHLLVALALCTACGGRKVPQPSPPAGSDAGSASGSGSAGSGSAVADCPDHIDCMPPTTGPCPPPGLQERCPNTQITY